MAPSLAGSVELTFDDGPDPVWTPAVLAALSGSSLHATFFVIASRAAAHPQIVAAIRSGGTPSSCTATSTCATPRSTAQ